MNNPKLYNKYNMMQKQDTIEVLEEYMPKLKWKPVGDRVIDVGCGDGSIMVNLLKRYLPSNIGKLVGCDKNPTMVQYAQQHYGNDVTNFIVLDAGGDSVLPELTEQFDHVFSIYAIHWMQEQDKAFTTIYNLLHEGGECLLIFLGYINVYQVYRDMAETLKWKNMLKDYKKYESPYFDVQEPGKVVHKILEKIGFKDISVTETEKEFVYDTLDDLKKSLKAVTPFPIPSNMMDEYMDDCATTLKEMNKKRNIKSDTKFLRLVVYARK